MLAVGVGFVGSGAVEAQVGVFDRQRPFQTESRNGRGFLSFTRIVDAQVQLAGGVCHIRDGDVRALRSGELVLVYGFQRIVIDLFDGVVDALGVTACADPLRAVVTVPAPRSLSVSARNVVSVGLRSTNSRPASVYETMRPAYATAESHDRIPARQHSNGQRSQCRQQASPRWQQPAWSLQPRSGRTTARSPSAPTLPRRQGVGSLRA